MVTFYIEEQNGELRKMEVPTDMNLNLMEVLKGDGYAIEATCGGMALCATCHIEVVRGDLHEAVTDAELDMLDTLPEASDYSRLACQVPIDASLEGVVVRLAPSEAMA